MPLSTLVAIVAELEERWNFAASHKLAVRELPRVLAGKTRILYRL